MGIHAAAFSDNRSKEQRLWANSGRFPRTGPRAIAIHRQGLAILEYRAHRAIQETHTAGRTST